jgi:hypothetical protein
MYQYLKVINGNIIAVNDAGNHGMSYWRKGNAVRAYWSDLGDKYVAVHLDDGKIYVLNREVILFGQFRIYIQFDTITL